MSVTLEVSKPETSSEESPWQLWNMPSIFVTFEVSQPETSSGESL